METSRSGEMNVVNRSSLACFPGVSLGRDLLRGFPERQFLHSYPTPRQAHDLFCLQKSSVAASELLRDGRQGQHSEDLTTGVPASPSLWAAHQASPRVCHLAAAIPHLVSPGEAGGCRPTRCSFLTATPVLAHSPIFLLWNGMGVPSPPAAALPFSPSPPAGHLQLPLRTSLCTWKAQGRRALRCGAVCGRGLGNRQSC